MMMKKESQFVSHLYEVFQLFGPIHARRMFGGYGIYHQNLMFGLVANDQLYLKVDSQSAPDFCIAGSLPFEYTKNGVTMKLSYFSAPVEIFDDAETAKAWAGRAFDAALRSKSRTGKAAK